MAPFYAESLPCNRNQANRRLTMPIFAIPLLESEINAWKDWIAECNGARSNEFHDFNNRMDLTEHRAWLDLGPQGPQVIVLHEGPGAATMMANLTTSTHPFDIWFRDSITRCHGMDFSKPVKIEAPQRMLSWTIGHSVREASG